MLSDFADAGGGEELTSWDILESEEMPESWDRGPTSPLFKVCLELRTQAVLHHCSIDDNSFAVDADAWAEACQSAFDPFEGANKETAKKNKALAARRAQLESYAKPAKHSALKQFAVNHKLDDAQSQLRAVLPGLSDLFPRPFLEQVEADFESGAYPPAAAVAVAPAGPEAAPPKKAAPKPPPSNPPARATGKAQPAVEESEEEEEEEDLSEEEEIPDMEVDDEPARRPRRRGGPRPAPPKRSPAKPSPAAAARSSAAKKQPTASPSSSRRRSARKAPGSSSGRGTLSASDVAAAGLPSSSFSLEELKAGSGLSSDEFIAVWKQEHPEVRNWLDMVEDHDDDDDEAGEEEIDTDTAASSVAEMAAVEDDEEGSSQSEALSDASNRPKQVQEMKAEAARLATLGGDDPLAASLAAGPAAPNGFGFTVPASQRGRSAVGGGSAGKAAAAKEAKGRFDRSPIFNKSVKGAVKHSWVSDEDEIEDEEEEEEEAEEERDPYAYSDAAVIAANDAAANDSVAAHLDSPRRGRVAPLDRQPLPTNRRGRGTVAAPKSSASSAAKKRPAPKPSLPGGAGAKKPRRKHNRWSDEENEALRLGVGRWGTKWANILADYDFNERTGVDLKDRWRNIQKNS